MTLSSAEIQEARRVGELVIDGFDPDSLRPSSYLLKIGRRILVERAVGGVIDTRVTDASVMFEEREMDESGFVVEPGQFYLASSVEALRLSPRLSGQLSLLSSLARCGLAGLSSNLICATFGSDAPGTITFEIANVSRQRIRIYPGVRWCHVFLSWHREPSDLQYRGIYSGASRPMPADFSRKPSR
ncbi:dCTP deaminase [Pyxidicoccus xibeiensis]|uniref:dCTP deaminase n=1 Tax=Pyxidicoccus xibeiensis TaxID=2906759 RepID=UPI003899A0C9